MASPKIFVRECPKCRQLAQTLDQTARTPCDACLAPPCEEAAPSAPEAEDALDREMAPQPDPPAFDPESLISERFEI